MTDNHGYNTPPRGAENWDVPLNANFAALDTDVEIRDTDAQRTTYDPKPGAKFLATDTEAVYLGDGTQWNQLPTTGRNPDFDAVTTSDLTAASTDLSTINDTVVVRAEADLPAPTNGVRDLGSNPDTAYLFDGIVTSTDTLELGTNTPLLGRHASLGGFIHTGGGTAITGTNGAFFLRNLYVHAPGGTLFDLTADASTECLVQSCSFSDAAGIANIADLGTINGYRVPVFMACNFESFDSGLRFDGNPDKVFFAQSVFRTVTAPTVSILTLAGTLDATIVHLEGCFVTGVQADTVVVDAEAGSQPSEVFLYSGNTHGSSVARDNILTGDVGRSSVGTKVTDSYPVADSTVAGSLSKDTATTVTGSGTAPTQVDGSMTAADLERLTHLGNGVLEYDARFDQRIRVNAQLSVTGANTDYAAWIAKNGTELPRSRSEQIIASQNRPAGVTTLANVEMTTGDTIAVFLENIDGSDDLTVRTMSVTI